MGYSLEQLSTDPRVQDLADATGMDSKIGKGIPPNEY